MKKLLFISMICTIPFALTACKTQSKAIQQEKQETWIETRYERIFIHDTSYVEIPMQTAEKTVKDSLSHLENDYAISDARINADGSLFHNLQTKPQKRPVPTNRIVERKDSVVYVDKEVKVPVMVEKELSSWQNLRLRFFNVLLIVLLGLLAFVFRKPIVTLIRRFI